MGSTLRTNQGTLGFTLTIVAQGATWTGKDIANGCREQTVKSLQNFSVEKIKEFEERRFRWESGHAIGSIFKTWMGQSQYLGCS